MYGREIDGAGGAGEIDGELVHPPFADLVLRSPPNWPAVAFLAMIGLLHLTFAVLAFAKGRWEGYLSAVLGTVLVLLAVACSRFRFELAVLASRRQVRLRTGIGRLCAERHLPFAAFRGVRLTLEGRRHTESRIELLCGHDDIECPPTRIPRQEALLLAMTLNVPLTKVSDEPPDPEPTERPLPMLSRRH